MTSAARIMPALSDAEDGPPLHRLRSMPKQDDRETTETELRPPPPSGELQDTLPPDPTLPSEMEAIEADRDDRTSVALRISSTDELLKMHAELKARETDLLEPEGKFAKLQGRLLLESQQATVVAIGGLVDTALLAIRHEMAALKRDLENQIELLRRDVLNLRERMHSDRIEYERKFGEQQACLDSVNNVLADLEKSQAKAPDARSSPAPAAT